MGVTKGLRMTASRIELVPSSGKGQGTSDWGYHGGFSEEVGPRWLIRERLEVTGSR